jgi:hypothetical protein
MDDWKSDGKKNKNCRARRKPKKLGILHNPTAEKNHGT